MSDPMSDLISRQSALDILLYFSNAAQQLEMIKNLPSVQSEQRWIPFQFRSMTDEEKERYLRWDIGENEEILCGEMPDDGQEILLSYKGYVFIDTFEVDEGCYLDGMGDIEHGMAWMPKPEPYKESEEC